MRIAFFVNYSHLSGTYFRWHSLAIALTNLGHTVDVYAGDHEWRAKVRHENRDGINYFIVPSLQTVRLFYRPNDFFSSLRRLFYLPKQKYDVYHLFQPFLEAYTSWRYLKIKNKNSVFLYDWDDLWINGLISKQPKTLRNYYFKKVTAFLEKELPSLSDGVTVCSSFLADRINSDVPIELIGNGFWPRELPSKVQMRLKWNFEPGIFYIAYIGKTAGELDWIIEAFDLVKKSRNLNVRLVIVGPPASQVNQYTETERGNMIYLGEVTPEESREIAAAVDLGLIPLENNFFNQSRFPIKFFDFLTVATPVYLSNVGEIALIGKDLDRAYVAPDGKGGWITSLSGVIQKINQGDDVNNDKKHILEEYSWLNLGVKLAHFYSERLKTHKEI